MSATMQQPALPEPDAYLMAQQASPQALELDPKYKNIRMWTPVGRIVFAFLETPKSPMVGNQNQALKFSCGILLNPSSIGDLYNSIVRVAEARFPPENRYDAATQQTRTYTPKDLLGQPGGLQFPIRIGNEYYAKDQTKYAAWHNVYLVNASTEAHDKAGNIVRPTVLDELGNKVEQGRVYSGCYGRLYLTIYSFPAPGNTSIPNKGIGVRLLGVQFAKAGEKMASYDPEAAVLSAAKMVGALPVVTPTQPVGLPGASPALVGMAPPPSAAPPPQTQPAAFVPPPQAQPAAFDPTHMQQPGVQVNYIPTPQHPQPFPAGTHPAGM